MEDKTRYNDEELAEFKELLDKKLEEAEKDLELLKAGLDDPTALRESLSQSEGEPLSLEEARQLAMRQEKFIRHLQDAQARIKNKTYGVCRVTGKLISKERLRLVPHATLSIAAKQQTDNAR
ncbi:MAG TPA: TraR/DksA C4-type zinc finger protein [Flavobacteriales bacterium]|nr:TraR/DksA C4-type zinc finger protein [Flavobacteriales bacterium]